MVHERGVSGQLARGARCLGAALGLVLVTGSARCSFPPLLQAQDGATDGTVQSDRWVDPDGVVNCGDGVLDSGEECDDGNQVGADGCSPDCKIINGWYCNGEPSQCVTQCGDNITAGSEECDDGNTSSGDGCSAQCQAEGTQCSNGSEVDCNFSSTTKNPSSAFVDQEPPDGFVQCAGFINTVADDVDDAWEGNCLGAVRTLRIRYWDTRVQPWILLGDATLDPTSTATFQTQTFDASENGGTEGVLAAGGVVMLKDDPLGGGATVVECDYSGMNNDYAANDLYLGNRDNTKTLWVCSGDQDISSRPCLENREMILVEAPMGDCIYPSGDFIELAIAIYYRIE